MTVLLLNNSRRSKVTAQLRLPVPKARNAPRFRATRTFDGIAARRRASGAPFARLPGQVGRARLRRAPNPLSERAGLRPESGAHEGFALRTGPRVVVPAAGSLPWSSTGHERDPTLRAVVRPPSDPSGGSAPNGGLIRNEGNLFGVLPRQGRHQSSRGDRESLRLRAFQL